MGCCCVAARHAVSLKKRRTVEQDVPGGAVDLDLAQIHRHIVCMGFPASGVEAFYRNRYKDALRYLDYKYGKDYFVYNLCAEPKYRYDLNFFHGRVREFPFPDHCACPLSMIPRFVKDALSYINSEDHSGEAVVVIHCKAGKGRTGLLACCLLMELEPSLEGLAANAVQYYGMQRAYNGSGLTIRSQIRYVEYYERLRNEYEGEVPANVPLINLHSFCIRGIQAEVKITACKWYSSEGSCVISLKSSNSDDVDVVNSAPHVTTVNVSRHGFFKGLSKDIRLEFLNEHSIVGALSFHTLFIQREYAYTALDRIYKLRKLPENAGVSLEFTSLSETS